MTSLGGRLRGLSATVLTVMTVLTAVAFSPPADAAARHTLITGDGSSWAANAINQWIGDEANLGLKVVYTNSGSAQGRKNFANSLDNFADSDLPYGTDPSDPNDVSSRPYGLLPVVAGGTSFPYHLTIAGQLYRDLSLSGATIAKIFTGQITNWNDPAITRDNNGQVLPSKTIVPVVHSDGSGETFQVTSWLASQYPSIWKTVKPDGLPTEYWPSGVTDGQIMQNGSDQVMSYITATDGAIGLDEYSYALAANYPAAKVENSAGYYVLPSQYNVAVALTAAKVDTSDLNDPATYMTQDLSGVYTNSDPRSYPISSYSYFIIPTSATDTHMSTAARQTLADFLDHALCKGQSEVGSIGYAPLPGNLVQAAFDQVAKLKAADPNVDLTSDTVATCDNPTFTAGDPTASQLDQLDPAPQDCDKDGQGPCGVSPTTSESPSPTPVCTFPPAVAVSPSAGLSDGDLVGVATPPSSCADGHVLPSGIYKILECTAALQDCQTYPGTPVAQQSFVWNNSAPQQDKVISVARSLTPSGQPPIDCEQIGCVLEIVPAGSPQNRPSFYRAIAFDQQALPTAPADALPLLPPATDLPETPLVAVLPISSIAVGGAIAWRRRKRFRGTKAC